MPLLLPPSSEVPGVVPLLPICCFVFAPSLDKRYAASIDATARNIIT